MLYAPDNQELDAEAEAYETVTEAVDAPAIAALNLRPQRHRLPDGQTITGRRPRASAPAHLITLDGKLVRCEVASFGRSLWLPNGAELVVNGMAGFCLPGDAA